jgi:hypothetical protein
MKCHATSCGEGPGGHDCAAPGHVALSLDTGWRALYYPVLVAQGPLPAGMRGAALVDAVRDGWSGLASEERDR